MNTAIQLLENIIGDMNALRELLSDDKRPIQNKLFPEERKWDFGLRDKTKRFVLSLYYGAGKGTWIDRKGRLVLDAENETRIKDISSILRSLKENGIIDIVYRFEPETNYKRIEKFVFIKDLNN